MSRITSAQPGFLKSAARAAIILSRRPALAGLCLAIIVTAGWASSGGFSSFKPRTRASRVVAPRPQQQVPVQVARSGRPWINVDEGHNVVAAYTGAPQDQSVIEQNQGKPLAMVSGDFDGDGVNDLAAGYTSGDRSVITLLRGNVDARYPNSAEAQMRRKLGQFSEEPFLGAATVIESPVTPDFMAAGDFNNDGMVDLAVASRKSNQLFLLAGGKGGFDLPSWIDLPGPVTALATSDVNRADGLADLVIGVAAIDGARLLVYERPDGALAGPPESYALPAVVTSVACGQLDNDSFADIAVAAGRQLLVLHGRDRRLSVNPANLMAPAGARIEALALAFSPNALAIRNFTDDPRPDGLDVALLGDDGSLYVLAPLPSKRKPNIDGLNTWTLKKLAAGPWPQATQLAGARLASLPVDSLIVNDAVNHQLQVVTDGSLYGNAQTPWPAIVSESLSVEGGAAALLAAQINGDALDDLIILKSDQTAPAVVPSTTAATFTVINTSDSGAGSLRQAIISANTNPGADTITFAIGSGAQTIALTNDLPAITDPVTIDGTTQPGYGGAPIIEINGAGLPSGLGFKISAGATTVRGLVVNRCGLVAVQFIQHGGDKIENCYVGADVAGTVALANLRGVEVFGISGCTVGGTTAAARNVISGNAQEGVNIANITPSGNLVQGNYIGVDVTGAAALANSGNGVSINANNNTIGGTAAGARNVISGNTLNGVRIFNDATITGNLVQGNTIGLNQSGSAAIPNLQAGVLVFNAPNNTVGGTAAGAGNLIGGNGTGVSIFNNSAAGVLVQGNTIGSVGLGNIGAGIIINGAPGNTVGGATTFAPNTISYNGGKGVVVIGTSGNLIQRNSIFNNNDLGIDLGDDGLTANDVGDPDLGANTLQNFPVLGQGTGGASVMIPGTLNSTPGTAFTIEFFANSACDPSGNGEGETYLGSLSVTTNASGNASFNANFAVVVSAGQVATATATDPNGNTSEFSPCAPICVFAIAPTSQPFSEAGGAGTINVTTSNGCNWTAVSNDAFITVTSGAAGSGSGVVGFSVAANPNATPRSGTITVAAQTFTVNQAAAPCNFSIAPTSQGFTSVGGSGTVTVTATGGCNWTAVSNDAFIMVTSGAAGSGNGTVGYTVAAKADTGQRTGTITIAGQTFTVTQSGIDCTYSIAPTSQNFPVAGGAGTVTVTTGGGCFWTAVSNDSFITITSGASGTGPGMAGFSVAPSANPGNRSGTMTIAGQTFTVTQDGTNPCTFQLTPSNQAFSASGGSSSVVVSTQPTCSWTAMSNAAFITVTNGAAGTGSGAVAFSVAANPTSSIRTGTIAIAGQTFTVTQAGTSCISTISPFNGAFTAIGGTGSFIVTATGNCSWTSVSLNSFITITSGATGSGSQRVKYIVAVNPSPSPRTGYIITGSQVHTVSQAGATCTFMIAPTSQTVAFGGGSGSITVTTQAGCNWTAVSNAAFITVTSGAAGVGSGASGFSVAANPSAAPRSGTITIAGQTFTVNQDPAPGSCTFSIAPMSQNIPVGGGSGSITVTTQAGCNWTAVSNAAFITVTSGAAGAGSGAVGFSVVANPDPSPRIGTITVAGLTFTVNQGGNCTISIAPSGKQFGPGGGVGTVSVTATGGCNWTAVSNDGWITVLSGAAGAGNGTVSYLVSANGTGFARTGTMTIGGNTMTIKQSP